MTFRDIFSSAGATATQGNGNPIQFGLGVQMNSVNQNFSQSSFQSTGNALDMALQGNGFFTLQTPSGTQVFSRAGNFTRNNLGYIEASDGSSVMGWNRDATGNVVTTGALAPVQVSSSTLGAQATTTIQLGANLNAAAAAGTTFQTAMQVYDSLGNAQNLTITYTKGAGNAWTYTVAGPAGSTIAGVPALPGTIAFDATGKVSSLNGGPTPPVAADNTTLNITWPGGSAASAISFAVINPDGTQSFTGLSSASTTVSSSQNGFPAGTLRDLTVDSDGMITGTFTNGQILKMAQLAVSSFTNVNGLEQAGNNHWSQTLASGAPTIGLANQGGRGAILGSNLELSNVDVASEFTKLIVSQRGYQANAKIVTTTDELLQETLNLKR
jgi:flagellar hook protein FlgE